MSKPTTAVIFSGQMRTFTTCAPLFKWQVLRHYPAADIFISTVINSPDDANALESAESIFAGHRVFAHVVPQQPNLTEPSIDHCPPPFGNSVPIQSLLRQLWQHKQAWEFYATKRTRTHDIIIRARQDSFFHDFTPPCQPSENEAFTPWWGRFGGANDRFAIMGQDAASAYYAMHDNLNDLLSLGCPMHTETIVRANLERCGMILKQNLLADFSTIRTDGTTRNPEVSASDVYGLNR